MLKTVYVPGFNKYVNQVHISLGMQMSLMRKDKLQNKQTKAGKMLNSSVKVGIERKWTGDTGICNPCSPGIV